MRFICTMLCLHIVFICTLVTSQASTKSLFFQNLADEEAARQKLQSEQKEKEPTTVFPNMLEKPKDGPEISSKSQIRLQLMKRITHPLHSQQNLDVLPSVVQVKLIPIKIQDLDEKKEILETTLRLQIVSPLTRDLVLFHFQTKINFRVGKMLG